MSNPTTGFNYWLAQACAGEQPSPAPYAINWSVASRGNQNVGPTNLWFSKISAENLDATSSPDDGTLCMIFGGGFANMTGTPSKFSVFGGTVEMGVEFDIAWSEADAPLDTESLADATDDAMIQTFNSASYFGSFGLGVIYNGLIRADRESLRQSGTGWRQRVPYRLTFELQA